ncbi:hypothetical protein DP113_06375 [Brasilonema octagenarum UFV-E1]|uniref:Uncharacterized protein n=1 Tax=Brasilonema octagenarum UFV-OR1 TaxID=417115 RepID=A0ABX1MGY3_9CYAN|nr:hypothetical protein [Brasilonema octagenarum UFV-OR1]QDL13941.1 hypothetical protein DP113_06375 [Brasilonema octagenarum UFV-E1]
MRWKNQLSLMKTVGNEDDKPINHVRWAKVSGCAGATDVFKGARMQGKKAARTSSSPHLTCTRCTRCGGAV